MWPADASGFFAAMPPKRGSATAKARAKTAARLKSKGSTADAPTACVSKFRFQYLDCKRMQDLVPGCLYWDRVSLSVPCAEVWQKVLQDPRFSYSIADGAAQPVRRLLTYPEMAAGTANGKPLFNQLAVFVYENVSGECRRQWAATQYWRARVKCFALWLQQHGALTRDASGARGARNGVLADDLPDPAAMTTGSADPYYRRSQGTAKDEQEACPGMADDHYNALRQSQRVTPTHVPFLNTLRMCYAEVSAPQGSLVLLRGQLRCSGRYVLAEYVERPEDELGSWRLAEYDEPLSGYRVPVEGGPGAEKKSRRVAYPWRRRKVRVICEIPKDVLHARGSNSVVRQGSSSKVLLKRDVAMLRAYAAKAEAGRHRAGTRTGALKRPAASVPADSAATLKRPAVAAAGGVAADSGGVRREQVTSAEKPVLPEQPDSAEERRCDHEPAPQRRLAAAAQALPRPVSAPTRLLARPAAAPAAPLTSAAKKSFQALYDLLESTHFPRGCRSGMSVTGFIPKNYLIFGLHRAARGTPCPNRLELTAATSFAFGKLDADAPIASRLRSPPAQYRELVQALQKHLLEFGMQAQKRGTPRGIRDAISGQLVPEKQVRFTSVMVAKNKRTYFHRDGNNQGASYQVVITDPERVASGDFTGGNLLCWPGLGKDEAERRTHEVRTFHEKRQAGRRWRREEQRQNRRELNPRNARWKGTKDVVRADGDVETLSTSESDEDFVLHEKQVDIRSVKFEEDIEDVEDRSLDSSQVPAYEDDATVVECVNRYVSFVGRDVWHATQPWRAASTTGDGGATTRRCANRYCITFFAVDLKDGDGAEYKRELRKELRKLGFRPHAPERATPGRGTSR